MCIILLFFLGFPIQNEYFCSLKINTRAKVHFLIYSLKKQLKSSLFADELFTLAMPDDPAQPYADICKSQEASKAAFPSGYEHRPTDCHEPNVRGGYACARSGSGNRGAYPIFTAK